MNGSTILIVDDEVAGRQTLKGLLSAHGYHLLFASNGMEALDQATENCPDLILLDVMMPGMDGYEVCRRLRSDARTAEVPVILVTALDDRDSRLRGIEAGADDFVSKPYDRAELRARVNTTTRLNRYRRLLTERTKFEWVVEQAIDGYLVINGRDEIQYANPRARRYLGLPLDEAQTITGSFLHWVLKQYRCEPQPAWKMWPQELQARLDELSRPVIRYLVRPETSSSQAFWLEVSCLDLPSGPDLERLICLHDITAQKALRRDMWQFSSLVSHKLYTPLAVMLASLEMLAEEIFPAASPAQSQLVELAVSGARRLNADIADILQYLVAMDPSRGAFPLAELPLVISQVGAQLKLAAITISGLDVCEPVLIPLSVQAVEVLLWELLENAQKFHPLQAPQVQITLSQPRATEVMVQVADDGLTLDPQQLDRVWTPYYQGEKFFSGNQSGMGMGMATVAALVWGIGGQCRMYNREGPGVVVELVLPVTPFLKASVSSVFKD